MDTEIIVRFTAVGFHRWPGASGERDYLEKRHRHLFHVAAGLEVAHDDREVELHDFLDQCHALWPGPELDTCSCETVARGMVNEIGRLYGRPCWVEVFEDGEVGARVTRRSGGE